MFLMKNEIEFKGKIDYNSSKYPTQDRVIEKDINKDMEGFYFRF